MLSQAHKRRNQKPAPVSGVFTLTDTPTAITTASPWPCFRQALINLPYPGTNRDAVLFAVSSNTGHGLQRTNTDKRKAVMTLIRMAEVVEQGNSETVWREPFPC